MSLPIQLVHKGDNWHLTIDYKDTVNAATVNDPYPIPIIMDSLQQPAKFKYFLKVDLSNKYWQGHTSDPKTCESTFLLLAMSHGTSCLKVPSIFQCLINSMHEKEYINTPGLFDDFIVGGMTAAECSAN
jgi:hypothetical protein